MGKHRRCHCLPSLCLPGSLSTMSAAPASNGVFVVIPPGNAGGLRPPPAILPTSMCQPPGIMQFEEPPLGAQTPRATQAPDLRPVETFLTGEPKALGVRTASPEGGGGGGGAGPGGSPPAHALERRQKACKYSVRSERFSWGPDKDLSPVEFTERKPVH